MRFPPTGTAEIEKMIRFKRKDKSRVGLSQTTRE
jgi:hypothetical protein